MANSSNQHRGLSVMIGKSVAASGATTPGGLAEGELGIVKQDGTLAVATETIQDSEYIYIAQGRASGLAPKYSNKIQGINVTKWDGQSQVDAVEQVSYVGFDGVSGSINAEDETEYSMHVVFKHDKDIWSERQHKKTQHYTTDGTGSEIEVASAMVAQFNSELETKDLAGFEVMSGDAGAPIAGTVTTFGVVNGSTTVAFNGTITNVSAGDYLRLGGTATTFAVYEVKAVTSPTSITLVTPYQGATAAISATSVEVITNALADAAAAGIKVTGKVQTFNTLDFYEQVNFELAIDGGFRLGSNTTIAEFGGGTSVSPSQGVGTYEKVFDLENLAQGYEGITNRVGFPIPNFPVYAVPGGRYDVYTIDHEDKHSSSSLNRDLNSPMQTILCIPVGASFQAAFQTIINDWMESTPKNFADVTL